VVEGGMKTSERQVHGWAGRVRVGKVFYFQRHNYVWRLDGENRKRATKNRV
jgi:hypothetical protein